MPGTAPGLSANDRKLLGLALDAGRTLERELALASARAKLDSRSDSQSTASGAVSDVSANEISAAETAFRTTLLALNQAASPLVRRQAEYANKVDASLGEKHLVGLLVPLERLLNRAARDEEFLYEESDRQTLSKEALKLKSEQPRVVICENLRSAFNVGAIFRTGECFLANEIWLTGYTAPPTKTAMGADELISWKSVAHSRDAIAEAKSLGFKLVALEVSADAVSVEDFVWPEKTALVLGNERFGIDSATLAECDAVVKIPTDGMKNSLNVGIAFGIAAASWRRLPASKADHVGTRQIRPIGFIKGGYTSPQAAPRQGRYAEGHPGSKDTTAHEAKIVLEGRFDDKPSNFEQALNDLQGFSHAWLLFGFHQSQSWLPQTRPPRGDGSLKGVFATRAPHRPNGLGLSCVRLLGIEGRTLRISHHDLLDGTPIYDIKPYVPEADSFPDARAGWIDRLPPPHSIDESLSVKDKLDWLEAEGETRLRPFIFEQLRYQPLDQTRKRIEILSATDGDALSSRSSTASELESAETQFTASFRTWRIHATFIHADSNGKAGSAASASGAVKIHDISSGYTKNELSDSTDIYSDKDLHRRFLSHFGDRSK